MHNQKGFIFPITLVLCLFISLACTHLLEIYLLEKRFYSEQDQIYTLESLMQMATVDLLDTVRRMEVDDSGEFYYENGTAAYWILEESHDTLDIQLKVMTFTEQKRVVRLLLDKEQMRVKEWIEFTMG